MSIGRRNPRPSLSRYAGGSESYQPPESSQKMKIAVEFQNGDLPIALTSDATHDGPVVGGVTAVI